MLGIDERRRFDEWERRKERAAEAPDQEGGIDEQLNMFSVR